MSDALGSERTLEAPSEGQVQRASEGQPQSGTDEQTSQGQSAEQENIRKLQSTYDKKLAEQQRDIQQARQQAQQSQQAFQQLQQRLQQMEDNAAPDDFARLELRARRAEEAAQNYATAYQQALKTQQAERDFQAAMQDLAAEFELSAKELGDAVTESGASDWKGAVRVAVKLQKNKEQRKQEQDDDKRRRNTPDVGGGAPYTSQSKWEADYEAAAKQGDSVEMMRLLNSQPKGGK